MGKEAGPEPDGHTPDQAPPSIPPWVRSYGDTEPDLVMDLVATDDGGACICGHFKGDLDIENFQLSPRGTQAIFIACFDKEGTARWAKKFGADDNYTTARAMALGTDGALYITGSYSGTLHMKDASITNAQRGIYLASFDLDGNLRWLDHLGESDFLIVEDLVVTSAGTAFVTGSFLYGINLGQGIKTSVGSNDIFLTSYNRTGGGRWRKTFGATGSDRGRALAVDSQGSVFLAGTFSGAVDFEQIAKTAKGDHDIFLTTFSPDGVVIRATRLGLTGNSNALSLAVDSSGNQYLTGQYDGKIKLAGVEYTAPDKDDGFLLAMDSMGTSTWAKIFTSEGITYPRELSVDKAGSIHAAGFFEQAVTVDGQLLEHTSNAGIFVAEFTPAGAKVSARAFPSTDFAVPEGIAADPQGLLLTGNVKGAVDLGFDSVLAKGDSYDLFISRLPRQ